MTKKLDGIISFYLKSQKDDEIAENKFETSGSLYKRNKKNFLFFEETNMDDNSKTKCRLEFDDQGVRLRRDGRIIFDQKYILKEITEGYLKTPHGELKTKVKTTKYEISKRVESNLTLQLSYQLFIAEEDTGVHQLSIEFKV